MKRIRKYGGGAGVLLATCSFAVAGDSAATTSVPVKAPVVYTKAPQIPAANNYDWNGWYVGAHVGVTVGSSNWSAAQPGGAPGLNGSFDLPFNFDFMAGTGSYVAGLQGGHNYVFPSRAMLGFETDISFPNSDVVIPFTVRGSETVTSPLTGQVTIGEAVIFSGTARARVGYAFDHFLLYRTGGLAWTYDQAARTQIADFPAGGFARPETVDNAQLWRLGWAAGAGVEIPVAGNWTAKAEYLWTGIGHRGEVFTAGALGFDSDLTMQSIRLGLNYRIDDSTPL